MAELIAIEEARERVLAAVPEPLSAEHVALAACLGRVLAEDARADTDLPPFDASAMDGFAVAVVAEHEGELEVVGESRAGAPAAIALQPGSAIRISTGAAVPNGTHAVVPVERTREDSGRVVMEAGPEPLRAGANVRRAGEDLRAGEIAIAAGSALGPGELAVLASLGIAEPACARRPRVAVLVTGDELVEPGTPLGPGQIRNSNGYGLDALARAAGAEPLGHRRVGDDANATRAALAAALDGGADAVVVSGGVSVGLHDHVKPALADLGVEQRFWGVALQPGKPTWFGVADHRLVFGLPGNPVSALVTFLLFVRPALRALLGADPGASRTQAILDSPWKPNPRRLQALRCRLVAQPDGWHAEPTKAQGSHVLSSLVGAGALALIPPGERELAAGERVEIELI